MRNILIITLATVQIASISSIFGAAQDNDPGYVKAGAGGLTVHKAVGAISFQARGKVKMSGSPSALQAAPMSDADRKAWEAQGFLVNPPVVIAEGNKSVHLTAKPEAPSAIASAAAAAGSSSSSGASRFSHLFPERRKKTPTATSAGAAAAASSSSSAAPSSQAPKPQPHQHNPAPTSRTSGPSPYPTPYPTPASPVDWFRQQLPDDHARALFDSAVSGAGAPSAAGAPTNYCVINGGSNNKTYQSGGGITVDFSAPPATSAGAAAAASSAGSGAGASSGSAGSSSAGAAGPNRVKVDHKSSADVSGQSNDVTAEDGANVKVQGTGNMQHSSGSGSIAIVEGDNNIGIQGHDLNITW